MRWEKAVDIVKGMMRESRFELGRLLIGLEVKWDYCKGEKEYHLTFDTPEDGRILVSILDQNEAVRLVSSLKEA